MRVIVALEGNALLCRGEKPDANTRIRNVEIVVHELAKLAEKYELVLIHGNGLQVDILTLQPANDECLSELYPFDTLGVQMQDMIGYWSLQAMQNAPPGHYVATTVNWTLVVAGDPAFSNPTEFVDEVYTKEEAEKLAEGRDWVVKSDDEHYRRAIGSPMPQCVIEIRLVHILLDVGATVVYSGGGGVFVVRSEEDELKGIEAIINKDLTASAMAEALEVDALLILTNVGGVFRDPGTENQKQVPRVMPVELRSIEPPSGSMGPKVEAVCRFVKLTGDMVATGRLEDVVPIIEGHAGTVVIPGGNYGGLDDIRPPIPEQLDTCTRRV